MEKRRLKEAQQRVSRRNVLPAPDDNTMAQSLSIYEEYLVAPSGGLLPSQSLVTADSGVAGREEHRSNAFRRIHSSTTYIIPANTKGDQESMDIQLVLGIITAVFTGTIVVLGGNRGLIDLGLFSRVVYQHTESLRCKDLYCQGVIIINLGFRNAKDVSLRLDCRGVIEDVYVRTRDSRVNYKVTEGGEGANYVVIHLDTITPHRNRISEAIIVSVATKETDGIANTKILYNQNKPGNELVKYYERPLRDSLAILMGLCAGLWIIFGNQAAIYVGIIVTLVVIANWLIVRKK